MPDRGPAVSAWRGEAPSPAVWTPCSCAPLAPGRPRHPDRRVPSARRRLDAGLPPRVGRGRGAPRALLVPRGWPAPPARGPRRSWPGPDRPIGVAATTHPICRSPRPPGLIPSRPSGPSSRAGRVAPGDAMPGSPAARSAPSPTTPSRSFEPSVPLPWPIRPGSRRPAFIETDLVIVVDHLTHALSAIASLHTEAPPLRGPLPDRRGARCSRPSSARPAVRRRARGQ